MSDLDEAKTPNQRLDSWKEIAAFFRRDERTVKRWEKERGLPVHRLQGSATGRVYAYSDELLRWMKSPVSAEPVASSPEAGGRRPRRFSRRSSAGGSCSPRQHQLRTGRTYVAALPTRSAQHEGGGCSELWCWLPCSSVTGGFLYLKRVSLRSGPAGCFRGKVARRRSHHKS